MYRMRTKLLGSGVDIKTRCILVGSADDAVMCCSVVVLEGAVADRLAEKRFFEVDWIAKNSA